MGKFEADTLYPFHFSFMSYILSYFMQLQIRWPPSSALILISKSCSAFCVPPSTHLFIKPRARKTGYLNHPLDVTSATTFPRQSSNFLALGFLFFLLYYPIDKEGIAKLPTHLAAVFICTKFAQRHLSLDSPHSALFVWKPIRLGGDFNGDLWSLGQHVLQLLSQLVFQLGGQLIRAVRMIAGVPLLSIWHRKVLRAEGWVRLAATNTAVRSANQKSSLASITVPLTAEEKQFPRCCVRHQSLLPSLVHISRVMTDLQGWQQELCTGCLPPFQATTFWIILFTICIFKFICSFCFHLLHIHISWSTLEHIFL